MGWWVESWGGGGRWAVGGRVRGANDSTAARGPRYAYHHLTLVAHRPVLQTQPPKATEPGGIPSPDQFRHRGVSRETHPLFAACTPVATTRHPDASRAPGAVFSRETQLGYDGRTRSTLTYRCRHHRHDPSHPTQPPVPSADQRDASSCVLTRVAIGKHAVKPGDSIPNRFTSPASPCTPGPSIRKSAAASPGPTNLGRIPA